MSKYQPNLLLCDSQGAISLAKNPVHHAKMKYIDVQLHFIRDHVEKGMINVEYCTTEDMLTDLMTKGLARERHRRLLGLMGVRTCEVTTVTPWYAKRWKSVYKGLFFDLGLGRYKKD
jgi:hypothetical protein